MDIYIVGALTFVAIFYVVLKVYEEYEEEKQKNV